ncbi:hypothetical protein HAP47_0033055 [Bradyrhizobium sp. 41S5]|uniref:hypothetical protein n=1 Tax=Bradyrhizobium sp. 41S5 TaxID=1404443 RepID=UPI00156ACA47|nr:hypothetical protein [Bradyrhizobium sp. 41S5]UFX43989.1 hypothetical protein HAP47_0033055 [Bradyrhizobium sp. 41S5]
MARLPLVEPSFVMMLRLGNAISESNVGYWTNANEGRTFGFAVKVSGPSWAWGLKTGTARARPSAEGTQPFQWFRFLEGSKRPLLSANKLFLAMINFIQTAPIYAAHSRRLPVTTHISNQPDAVRRAFADE